MLSDSSKLSTDDYFALKKIPQSQNEPSKEELEFWKEVDALKRFSGFVHDHLVTLLMTWTTKNPHQYCLLFPWAGNDLDFYWEQNNPPINGVNPDIGVVRWIAKQITGMAGALDAIHNPRYDDTHLKPKKKYGRHGDIKPENILWYDCPNDERGIWVIADLGLTAFNTTNSRSNVPGEGIPVSPGYRPPECDLEGGVISQAFDIWTFGCLLLEMVCWALGGQTNRAQFKAHRMTPYITGIGSNIFFSIDLKGQGRGFAIGVKRQVSEVSICDAMESIKTDAHLVDCASSWSNTLHGVLS
jgi:serine/threonine protein kinase